MDALSYWEHKHWLSQIDYAIVGSGIVGLHCALALRKKAPKAKIVIFEKGVLPHGASTKNAGFTCFGSISEIVSDIEAQGEAAVLDLVAKRFKGVQLLRETLGDAALDYQNHGGHEVFLNQHEAPYNNCLDRLELVNDFLEPVFKGPSFYKAPNRFKFKGVQPQYISSAFEGQIDTGLCMQNLTKKVQKAGVHIFYGLPVSELHPSGKGVLIKTPSFECNAQKVCLATNGFSKSFGLEDVAPARAQVIITKPIKGLSIKGAFHMDMGYYYFRNVEDRILLGGARNLDFKTEETTSFEQTPLIQDALKRLLKECILPDTPFEIDLSWSGIMGVGKGKHPIVKKLDNAMYCGVRLGGMGVALGAQVGLELAELCLSE
jgi:glycine/D-amino acid oxidase-like deaminating enzyme